MAGPGGPSPGWGLSQSSPRTAGPWDGQAPSPSTPVSDNPVPHRQATPTVTEAVWHPNCILSLPGTSQALSWSSQSRGWGGMCGGRMGWGGCGVRQSTAPSPRRGPGWPSQPQVAHRGLLVAFTSGGDQACRPPGSGECQACFGSPPSIRGFFLVGFLTTKVSLPFLGPKGRQEVWEVILSEFFASPLPQLSFTAILPASWAHDHQGCLLAPAGVPDVKVGAEPPS